MSRFDMCMMCDEKQAVVIWKRVMKLCDDCYEIMKLREQEKENERGGKLNLIL